jgi:hypothetical protein
MSVDLRGAPARARFPDPQSSWVPPASPLFLDVRIRRNARRAPEIPRSSSKSRAKKSALKSQRRKIRGTRVALLTSRKRGRTVVSSTIKGAARERCRDDATGRNEAPGESRVEHGSRAARRGSARSAIALDESAGATSSQAAERT